MCIRDSSSTLDKPSSDAAPHASIRSHTFSWWRMLGFPCRTKQYKCGSSMLCYPRTDGLQSYVFSCSVSHKPPTAFVNCDKKSARSPRLKRTGEGGNTRADFSGPFLTGDWIAKIRSRMSSGSEKKSSRHSYYFYPLLTAVQHQKQAVLNLMHWFHRPYPVSD